VCLSIRWRRYCTSSSWDLLGFLTCSTSSTSLCLSTIATHASSLLTELSTIGMLIMSSKSAKGRFQNAMQDGGLPGGPCQDAIAPRASHWTDQNLKHHDPNLNVLSWTIWHLGVSLEFIGANKSGARKWRQKKCHQRIIKQFVLCHDTADASGMILWQQASAADRWIRRNSDYLQGAVFTSLSFLQTFQTFHHIEILNIANDLCMEY